jgi:hypothetical protein
MTGPTLPITVRYDSDRTIEISATPAALRELARLLRASKVISISISPMTSDPEPARAVAHFIRVRPSQEKVRIDLLDDGILISGAIGAREILASNLDDFAASPEVAGDHLHIDYFPGHYYLGEGSLPLVVSRD